MSLIKHRRKDLRALLFREHAALEQRFAEVLAAFRANAREEVVPLWTSFEEALLDHMELEEQIILPELAKRDPRAVAAMEAEHKQICRQLEELGVGVDLHRTRTVVVEKLIDTLRDHIRREEALLLRGNV